MKRVVLAVIGLMVAVTGVWAYAWWHTPAETKDFTTTRQTDKEVLGSESTLKNWTTQYFMTRYPNDLRVIASNEVSRGIIDGQYLLASTALNRTDQLAVTVGTLDGLTFEELPAIKIRRQNTATYHSIQLPEITSTNVSFVAPDTYELSTFWHEGSRYASVVVSGSSARSADLKQALEVVVQNWQWQ